MALHQRLLAFNHAFYMKQSGDAEKRIGLGVKTCLIAADAHAHVRNPVARAGGRSTQTRVLGQLRPSIRSAFQE